MLVQDATPRQLEEAAALNHSTLFRQEAATLGGTILSREGLEWTSGSPTVLSMVPFPSPHPERAGDLLDELIAFYLRHPPKGAGCWSLDPITPGDLGIRLLARGYQPGWRPRWMGLDLNKILTGHDVPRGLAIVRDNTISLEKVKDLPNAHVIIPAQQYAEMPGQWMHFIARLQGKVVGHSVVFLSTGPYGAAGIYHVGVIPALRCQGIGKAVTFAACMYARDKGYRYVVLNSTDAGRRTYEQLGFTVVGEGWTWWLFTERLLAHPPTPLETMVAEAVGRGDVPTLQRLQLPDSHALLARRLTNGMTLMELAAHCRQPGSAEWLAAAGVTFSVLDAWDLGWKERALQLLQHDPGSVNKQYGDWDKTLLHIAAERNDQELARLALSATPDLRLKDKAYQSTSLDWARQFGHAEIVRLIEECQ